MNHKLNMHLNDIGLLMRVRSCVSTCDSDSPLDKKVVWMPLMKYGWELYEKMWRVQWKNNHVH